MPSVKISVRSKSGTTAWFEIPVISVGQNTNPFKSYWSIIEVIAHLFACQRSVADMDVHKNGDGLEVAIDLSPNIEQSNEPTGSVQKRLEEEIAIVASPQVKRVRRNSDVSVTSDVSVSFAWPARETPCRFHINRSMPLCTALEACARSHSDDPVEQLRLRIPSREVDYEQSVDGLGIVGRAIFEVHEAE